MRTTIDSAGRIVVPKSVRDAMGLRGGQEVDIVYVDGRIEIEVPPMEVRLERRGGVLVAVPTEPVPALTAESVREVVEELRAERSRRVL